MKREYICRCRSCGKQFVSPSSGNTYCNLLCHYEMYVTKNEDGCWGWTGSTVKGGYGLIIQGRGVCVRAPLSPYDQFVEPIPDGMNVLLECDNPPCTRPDHLFLGDHKANHDDMVTKGRGVSPPIQRG